jgi:putative ABC transport system ATP-binding protein
MPLSLKNISLSLGEGQARVEILKNISLEVKSGQTLSLLGASGSGKSSLLMVMAGLEQAQTGSVTFENHVLSTMNEDDLASFRAQYIGIVFQSFHLIGTLTALENVMLPLELSGHKTARQTAIAELTRVGLGERLTHYPRQLSGGEQQRVALARAFAPRPQLIFADEPTGNLDETTGENIISLIFERVKEANSTLILVTHDEGLAKKCTRQVRLKNGTIESDSEA